MTKPISHLTPTEIRAMFDKVKARYDEDAMAKTVNTLLLGRAKIGKSQTIAKTARHPVHMDSFDPGGVSHLKPEVKKGLLIPDTRFEVATTSAHRVFMEWEKEFKARKKAGYFNYVGTYCLDSFTSWVQAIGMTIRISKGLGRKGFTQPEYLVILNTVLEYLAQFLELPCHFIITGHLQQQKDEIDGKIYNQIVGQPSLRNAIPSQFDECYVMLTGDSVKASLDDKETKAAVDKSKRYFLTDATSRYDAGTRIGRKELGNFSQLEEPNFTRLWKKAGFETEPITL